VEIFSSHFALLTKQYTTGPFVRNIAKKNQKGFKMNRSVKKTRIFGCGNPLMGNDGAGVRTIQRLREIRPDLDLVDGGTGGLGLIGDMDGFDRIIIVDAMLGIGKKKGDIKIFYDTPPVIPSTMSLHDAEYLRLLRLQRRLFRELR
jgi:hydrogenase maturation protease